MKKQILILVPFIMVMVFCNQQRTGGNSRTQDTGMSNKNSVEKSQKKESEASYNLDNELLAKNTIFIDPSYSGTEKGTKEQPFKDFKRVNWKNGISVLVKRGTQMFTGYSIRPDAESIVIGAYGNGNRPIIKSTLTGDQKIIDLGGLSNITVSDLEIVSLNNALTCFHLYDSKNGKLVNCKVSGSQWGIRNLNSSGTFQVINCEVSNTGDDGIFIKNVDTVEFSGNHVYDVNQKYHINPSEKFSGGDCIQLFNVKYFKISGNKLDHGSTGNKFCFISNGDEDKRATGIIEKNTFLRKGSGILVYLDVADNILIKQNRFLNAEIALYNHSADAKIYYNEFVNINGNVLMIDSKGFGKLTQVINNTFANINNLSNFYKEDVLFVNNIFYKCSGTMFTGTSGKKPEYNCFFDVKNDKDLIGDSSIFADPLFKNADSLDFSLKKNSPCISRGKAEILLNLNTKQNRTANKSAVDIGAHVFTTGN
jgi:hypothetical protein